MPTKKNIYCGIGKVPTDKIRGTAKECIVTNQVRYYGIKKIDIKLIENKDLMNPDKELKKLRKMEVILRGMANKLKKDKNNKNVDQAKLDKLKKKIKKTLAEYNNLKKVYEKAKKYMDN